MNEIIPQTNQIITYEQIAHPALSCGPILVTPIGLVLRREPTWEEWQGLYDKLARLDDFSNWAIGDAEAFTHPRYGEAAAQLTAKWPEHSYSAIRQARNIAEKVQFDTRVSNLNWSHHRLVAKLLDNEQRIWLAEADKKNWSHQELRAEMRKREYQNLIVSDTLKGKYNIIVIDPPWPYGTDYDMDGRRAASQYPEQSLEDIAKMPIPAADNCVLWLWTTHKFMRYSFAILDIWGFREVAIATWEKDQMGLGQWLRSQTEFCIMAVKGKPVVNLIDQTTIIHGPMREHSRKPDEFYEMVESLCIGRRADYYSREKREGWDQYGNELAKFV